MEPKTDVDPRSLLEHRDFVRGVVRGLLADEHAVDDVVQEACLRAIERPPRHAALKAWLARVGRNLALTALRAQRRRGQREHEAARPEGQPSASDAASKLERHRLVVEAVLALEEPFRSAILLRFYEDLPPREIARQLGVPVDTVRSRLRRGIERMRAWFDARHGGNRAAWSLLLLPLLGVRAAAAATAAATAAGGGTKVLALGGAAMTMKAKLVGAAIVVFAIAAGVVTWQATAARDRPAAPRTEGHRTVTEEGEVPVDRADATATVENPGTLPDRGIGPPAQSTTVYQGSATTGPIIVATGPGGPKPYRIAEPCGEAQLGALRVIVTDSAGSPLPGAKVLAGFFKNGRASNTNSEADGTGRLELRSLEPGKWSVSARAGSQHRSAMVEVEAGRFTEIAFALAGGATVEGMVRHVERGPLADVRMSFSREDGGFADHFRATTDAEGRYRLEGVPPGNYPVRLEGGLIGYEPRPRAMLVVPGPGTVVQDLVLGRVTLRGAVRDADTGAPIAAVKIQFQNPWYGEVSTGSDGAYTVLDLLPADYRVCLMRDGYGTEFSQTGQVPPDGTGAVDFTLRRAAVLVLEVLDGDGQPIVGQIQLGMQPLSVRMGEIVVSGTTGTVRGSVTSSGTALWTSFVADSSGIGRYPRIVPGLYHIDVRANGYLRGTQSTVEIKPGDNRLTFRLEREPETAVAAQGRLSLEGTVRDSTTGRPIAGVRVCVQDAGFREAFSDAQGAFRLREVPPGKWTVHVSRDGYGFRAFRDVEFTDAALARDFELAPAATLHVHATDPAGRPVEGRLFLGVHGREEGLTRVGTSIDADGEGHGVYRQILPGRYELRIQKENVGEGKVEVEILPGENVVRVRLE